MNSLLPLLRKFGLTKNEAKIYLFLLTLKEARASEIAKETSIPRNKIYEIVEGLSKKGFVEILPEKVLRYRALPFESAFDFYIKRYQRRIKSLQESKEQISEYLKKALVSKKGEEQGYFAVIRSKSIIYKKIEEMLSKASKNCTMMINSSDIRRLSYSVKDASKKMKIRVLSPINADNKNLAKKWLSFSELRHYEAENNVKIVIIDDSEILVFQTNVPMALYSNDPQFVAMLISFVSSIWENSPPGKDKLNQLETGKPIEEIRQIRGRENIYQELGNMYGSLKKDAILMTTSHGTVRYYKYLRKFAESAIKRGVRIRILTHVNKTSTDYIKKLTDAGIEIRHVENIYAVLSCYDESYMNMMRVRNDNTSLKSDDISIITNQEYTVKMMRQMLEEMWIHGIDALQMVENLEKGTPIKEMKVITGKENIYKLLRDITSQAKKEICMIATEKSLERAIKHDYLNIDKKLSKKTKIRYIIPITKNNIELAKKAMKFAEVRHVKFTPIRVRIIDSEKCTIRYGGEESEYLEEGICVFSNVDSYVATMKDYFEKIWMEAVDAEEKIKQIEIGKPVEETRIISGKEKIYKILSEITTQAKKEICIMSTEGTLDRSIKEGTLELGKRSAERGVRLRYIFPITKKNKDIVKKAMKFAEIRHIDFTPIRMRMVDDEKCTLRYGSEDVKYSNEVCIFSNTKSYVSTAKEFFENTWNSAIPVGDRIKELETGRPAEETRVIYGKENIYKVWNEITKNAKKEICVISTENAIERCIESGLFDMAHTLSKKGVGIRYVMPITKKNKDLVKELMSFAEVRHIDFTPIGIRIVDEERCTLRHGGEDIAGSNYVCVYSDIKKYVLATRKYFENVWRSAIPAEEKIREIEKGKPITETRIIPGLDNALLAVNEINVRAKKEVCHVSNEWTFERLSQMNILNAEKELSKKIKFRYLVTITKNNIDSVKKVMKYAEVRHADIIPLRMRIADDNECVMRYGGEDKVIDTIYVRSNVKEYVKTLKDYFEKSWEDAVPAEEKIKEIEEGIVPEEVKYLRGRENLYSLAPKLILNAKKDIIFMATEAGIIRMYSHLGKFIEKASKKGVRIRFITQITDQNREIIKKFKSAEIKHIDKVYSVADCYDDNVLTILQTKHDSIDTFSPSDTIIYSTQSDTVKMIRQMLEESWNHGLSSEERIANLEGRRSEVMKIREKIVHDTAQVLKKALEDSKGHESVILSGSSIIKKGRKEERTK